MNSIILDDTRTEPYYIQIYNYFKDEIISGKLSKGSKLPSIRGLSNDIKVSKTTVESAYNQLLVEGYVNNISKKGYFVVELKEYNFKIDRLSTSEEKEKEIAYYINSGVDRSSFDTRVWKKLYGNILIEQRSKIFTRGDYKGEKVLRDRIREFVQETRGIKCSSEQIIIGAGIQYLLGILCSLLKKDNYSVAVEYPGFKQAINVFEDYGMIIINIPVYDEGIDIEKLKKSHVNMVYLSPSHQYPTGSVMPIDKRLEILNWANENQSIIIEDDYDCLIRYESRPIPALKGLDKGGQVIYLGSFSKILLPSLRISYMILPKNILTIYEEEKTRYSQSSSKIEQLTLAKFMEEGYLDKHIRRIRKIYHTKNEAIVKYIEEHGKDKIRVLGHDSGLHMMLELKTDKSLQEVINEAAKHHILLEMVEGNYSNRLIVVFSYSGLDKDEIETVLGDLLNNIL